MKNTSSYLAFARKYRPANFSELLGQEVLTKIISYSIINNRLAQGYLLTGIRGVGKTTSARIIAKTINCNNPLIAGNEIKPCDHCQNCLSFKDHNHPDIIEIDAASKTGIEDIRGIIESSEYRPLLGKYKIFIIDEVHMLSKNAFNALLKVLEEPPQHVVFIFATTEVQKIPLTVISRCQRYDLRRLTFDEILSLIENIAQKENLKIEADALKLIASKSEGSARDATSMLDQIANFNEVGGIITITMINEMLGSVDTDSIIEFCECIINNDVQKAIELVNRIYFASANLEEFVVTVSNFVAYLSKSKMLINYHDPVYSRFSERISNILIKTSLAKLSILWQIFSNDVTAMKVSHNQLITAEMLVIKAIYSHSLSNLEDIIKTKQYPQYIEKAEAKIIKISDNKSQTHKDKKYIITDFLKYLHSKNEMEIYYLLLNSVQVKSFEDNLINIAGENIPIKLKDQISNLLFAWTGEKWNVLITKQLEICTLKHELIEKLKVSEEWKMIQEHFPEANISDILIKT